MPPGARPEGLAQSEMAKDGLAHARLSKRNQSLDRAIEENLVGSERRSRENGWSYVEKLTGPLGKWPPPARGKPRRR